MAARPSSLNPVLRVASGSVPLLLIALACSFRPPPSLPSPVPTVAAPPGDISQGGAQQIAPEPDNPTLPASPTPGPLLHTVAPGETLSTIARQYGVTIEALMAANFIGLADALSAGLVLHIPDPDPALAPTPDPRAADLPPNATLIGYSTLGYPITAYRFGAGQDVLLLVGGIHGGYEWNTILLAYALIDYLEDHPDSIPASLTVYVIPSANPDGQVAVAGKAGRFTAADVVEDTVPGRFNGNRVDLNRNWECYWEPVGYWGEREVSGGTAPFSEIENRLLRDFAMTLGARAVVFWHSAFDAVFSGGCDGLLPAAIDLGQVYADASGYPIPSGGFTAYPVTGDATDWFSLHNIPAITVELTTHSDLDWDMNLAGVLAILAYLDGQVALAP